MSQSHDVSRIHNRNTIFNAAGEGFWGFAMAFHNINSVIPLLLAQLGASPIIIGMIPGGFVLLVGLPQLLSVWRFRGFADIKKLNITMHFLIAPWIALMVLWFFVLQLQGSLAIMLYLITFIFYSLMVGSLIPIWADFLASVSLQQHRSRFFGITFAINAIMGMAGGFLLKAILDSGRYAFPRNYGFGFLIMLLATTVGTCLFLFLKVIKPPDIAGRVKVRMGQALKNILVHDHNFRRYFYSRALGAASVMPLAFYAIYLDEKLHFSAGVAGEFTLFLVIGTALFNFIFGILGDRVSRKFVILFFFIGHLLALYLTTAATTTFMADLVFVAIGMATGAMQSSFMVFVYEFAGEAGDRKLYYAAMDSALAPVLFVYIMLAGKLVEWVGYSGLFGISTVLVLSGLMVFIFGVRKPSVQLASGI